MRSVGRSGSTLRQAQQTPGLKRGISLADRGSNATRHNSPTVDQLRQAAKPAAQTASRSSSGSRSAAPGFSPLCTTTLAGGWVGCGGNVWGHVGTCGQPAKTTTCAPGTWLVLQLPLPPSPQGSDDDDWSDDIPPPVASPGNWSDAQPLAAGPGSPGGGVLTPFDWKTTSTNSDCVGPAGGTAFFGVPGNPDQPLLDCGNEGQAAATASPADISQFPLVAEPGAGDYPDPATEGGCSRKANCKEIACEGNTGTISAAVPTPSANANHVQPFVMMKYQGTNAAKLKWIQFIWIEVLIRKNPGDALQAWGGNLGLGIRSREFTLQEPLGGWVPLTTDATKPEYRVDALDRSQPYYEIKGAHAGDSTSELIVDQPGSAIGLVPNDPPIYEIRQYDHFEDYLISDTGKICGKISWTASFRSSRAPTIASFNPATVPEYQIGPVEQARGLQQAEIRRLQTEFPNYPTGSLH